MSIAPIEHVSAGDLAAASARTAGGQADATTFADLMRGEWEELNGQLLKAEGAARDFALGEEQNIHRTLMRIEDARVSFELMIQVRDKLLKAYQDVMKMRV